MNGGLAAMYPSRRSSFRQRFACHPLGRIGIGVLVVLSLLALLAPVLAPYSPVDTDLSVVRQPPQAGHWLGTDELGRDVLSRLLYGARVSLSVGLAAVILSTLIGFGFGLLSGYAGGITDNILMRLIDGLLSIPTLVLVIAIQSLGTQGLTSVVLVIAGTSWMQVARLVRTEFLGIKQRTFIKGAIAAGTTQWNLVFRHIVPNCLATVIVIATLDIGHAIVTEAALSFLGMGIPPHEASWGNMLMGGQRSILAGVWWITLFPGAMIVITVLATTLVGDAIRDSLDPLAARKKVFAAEERT